MRKNPKNINLVDIDELSLGLTRPESARTFLLMIRMTGQGFTERLDYSDDREVCMAAMKLFRDIRDEGGRILGRLENPGQIGGRLRAD